MADRTVSSTLTDLEWIQDLGGNLWYPRRRGTFRRCNGGFPRSQKLRLTRPELDRVKQVVREHALPCEILHTRYGTELAIFMVERGRRREIMRLTHWHVPSFSTDPRHRRGFAARLFTTFMKNLERDESVNA